MEASTHMFIAVFAGYAASLGLWFALTRRFQQQLWVPAGDLTFERPGRELAWALLTAVGIFVVSTLYSLGHLFSLPSSGWTRKVAFLGLLMLVWSPLALHLWLRHQTLETCLASLSGWPKRLAWGFAGSLVAMLTFHLIRGNDPRQAFVALWSWQPIDMVQSLIQFAGFGFLLTRLIGVLGRRGGILTCGLLYGLVKYPYYLNQLHMSWAEATVLIAFSSFVACTAIYLAYDRRDVVVPAIVHVFMDMSQVA